MPTTGPQLRKERLTAYAASRRVTATAVALEMGVSRGQLYVIEASLAPDPKYVSAHREAVKTLRDATETAA